MDDSPGCIVTGSRGSYLWLTSSEDYIGTLMQSCPEVLLGRYLAVTSIDSGSRWLTERQKIAGWELRRGVAYSPAPDTEPFYKMLKVLFWTQLERARPESYIADGRDCLTFVTRNSNLFELVRQRLTNHRLRSIPNFFSSSA